MQLTLLFAGMVLFAAIVGGVAMLRHAGLLADGDDEGAPDGGPTPDDRQDERGRGRPVPFVPPGSLPPLCW